MFKDQNKLATELLERNILTQDQMQNLLVESQGSQKTIEELAVSKGFLSDERLAQIKGELLNVAFANLSGMTIPREYLKIIPIKAAENYQIIAFDRDGETVKIAMVDPQNFKAIEAVEFLAKEEGWRPQYYITSQEGFLKAIRQTQLLSEEAEEALAGLGGEVAEAKKTTVKEEEETEQKIQSAPVSKIVLVIIRHAVDGRASDIHIEPTMKDSRVRYRIDGVLHTSLILPKYIHSSVISRIKVMSNLKLDETRKPQDGRIRLNIEGSDVDFRISTLPLYDGEKVVMRILKSEEKIPNLADLGFNRQHISAIEAGIKKTHGMLLITGPTGSGKTSTLYTILSMLNNEGINIITLEDPVEYYMDGVNQSQINPEVGYTFASGLRSILRQDPNIIMLGEIRDEESAELVIHASLTGHMVLTTLHTNDSIGAVSRLIDMKAPPFLLASTLNMVLAQRLARRNCPKCKKQVSLPKDVLDGIKDEIAKIPKVFLDELKYSKLVFYKGEGCSYCGGSGFRGRVAIAEVIEFTDKLQELVVMGYKISDVMNELKNQNFITLRQDGILKAVQGFTSLEEVFRVSQI